MSLRKFVSRLSAPILRRAASSYIAGPEVGDAMETSLRLQARGFRTTIAFWNGDEDSPRSVADAYLLALQAMCGQKIDYLSVKLPALAYSPLLLEEILSAARQSAVRIHFDSLAPETAGRTFAVIDEVLPRYGNLSVTISARWKRSLRDIDWAIERKLPMRIVKGQWPDDSAMDQTQAFMGAIRHLAGRVESVSIATHDPKLADESLEHLQRAATRTDIELLLGLPPNGPLQIAARYHVPVRFYIPYGHAWLPYCFSQARKNPRILCWMLKDAFLTPALPQPQVAIER